MTTRTRLRVYSTVIAPVSLPSADAGHAQDIQDSVRPTQRRDIESTQWSSGGDGAASDHSGHSQRPRAVPRVPRRHDESISTTIYAALLLVSSHLRNITTTPLTMKLETSLISLLLARSCTAIRGSSSGATKGSRPPIQCNRPPGLSLLLESFVPPNRVTPQLALYYQCEGRQLLRLMLEEDSNRLDAFESPFKSHYLIAPLRGWQDEAHDEAGIEHLQEALSGLEDLVGLEGFSRTETGFSLQDPQEWVDETLRHAGQRVHYRNILSGDYRFISEY